MRPVDDATLTHDGFRAESGGRVCLIACGALAREILALVRLNRWSHVDLRCLPAILHNYPERITPAVEAAVAEARSDGYDEVFVVYADCGTGGLLAKACDRLGVGTMPGPHCYAFFEGLDTFAAHDDEIGAFYLTDFLVRQFDAFVWRPLGLDRHPELRDVYFGHYDRLVYLAQTDNSALDRLAEERAERLGLAFEKRKTGYGDLTPALEWLTKA